MYRFSQAVKKAQFNIYQIFNHNLHGIITIKTYSLYDITSTESSLSKPTINCPKAIQRETVIELTEMEYQSAWKKASTVSWMQRRRWIDNGTTTALLSTHCIAIYILNVSLTRAVIQIEQRHMSWFFGRCYPHSRIRSRTVFLFFLCRVEHFVGARPCEDHRFWIVTLAAIWCCGEKRGDGESCWIEGFCSEDFALFVFCIFFLFS